MDSSPDVRRAAPGFGFSSPGLRAFTLIELLVVIGIIGILASIVVAFIIPKSQQATLHQATAEMRMVQTAIESYKADFGTYPPDNQTVTNSFSTWNLPRSDGLQPLFYELNGAVVNQSANGAANGTYGVNQTLISRADYSTYFGLAGPQNSSPAGVRSYLKDLRPAQYKLIPGSQVYVLTCSVGTPPPSADLKNLNPWSYNSSSPTYNPGGFDLFNTNILVGNKYYTIGNWNR